MNGVPACYGELWEAQHPQCYGGLDPAFTHPTRKDHRHDRCHLYSSCASKTSANRLSRQASPTSTTPQQVIPAQNLVRHHQPQHMPAPFQSIVRHVHNGTQAAAAQAANLQAPSIQIPYAHPATHAQGPMVHPAHASAPWQVPMNFQVPGAQMPAYLTVPEPIFPGEGTFKPLVRTILRSVLKAGCHSMANFFDHVPMTPWPAPPPQG